MTVRFGMDAGVDNSPVQVDTRQFELRHPGLAVGRPQVTQKYTRGADETRSGDRLVVDEQVVVRDHIDGNERPALPIRARLVRLSEG